MNDDSMNAAVGISRPKPLYHLLYRILSSQHAIDRDSTKLRDPRRADICQTESNDKINLFSWWDIGPLPSAEVQKAQTKTGT